MATAIYQVKGMLMAQVEYRFAYVSGAFLPLNDMFVMIANIGATIGVVQVLGFNNHSQFFDSMVNTLFQPGFPYSSDGHVKPGHIWTYTRDFLSAPTDDPVRVVIRTTTEYLVPSIQLRSIFLPDLDHVTTETVVFGPKDFMVFPIHVPPLGPVEPTPPASGS